MKFAGNQPYFIPYIGYWQLINAVDVFALGDDYNYIKGGWINRNRILDKEEHFRYINIDLSHASSNKLINEIEVSLTIDSIDKKMRILENSYGNAPYFKEGMQLMNNIYNCGEKKLIDFLEFSIKEICSYIGIDTKIIRSSSFEGNDSFRKEDRIYDQCKKLNADTYYNAIGGRELYNPEEFKKHNINIKFIKTGKIEYKQFDDKFEENLSIIDVIMFNSKEDIKKMLNNYELV